MTFCPIRAGNESDNQILCVVANGWIRSGTLFSFDFVFGLQMQVLLFHACAVGGPSDVMGLPHASGPMAAQGHSFRRIFLRTARFERGGAPAFSIICPMTPSLNIRPDRGI